MEPDAVQKQNEPFECRFILLGALRNAIAQSRKAAEFGPSGRHFLAPLRLE